MPTCARLCNRAGRVMATRALTGELLRRLPEQVLNESARRLFSLFENRTIPVKLIPNHALLIDEQEDWRNGPAVLLNVPDRDHLVLGKKADGKPDPIALDEPSHLVLRVVVAGCADGLEPLRTQILLHPVQHLQIFDAVGARRRKNSQDDDLALILPQIDFRAVCQRDGYLGNGPRLAGVREQRNKNSSEPETL